MEQLVDLMDVTYTDGDQEMYTGAATSEAADDKLPDVTSTLEKLIIASDTRISNRKRASSCPARLDNDGPYGAPSTPALDIDMTEPRSDPVAREGRVDITVENAQTLLDPNACIFVANLPIGAADEEMQVMLTQFLGTVGEVYVKVNRTRDGIPFAHAQYKDENFAKEAMETKHHQLLWGRQLRIEPAAATRFLYVGRRSDSDDLPSESEIRVLFNGFAIERVRLPSDEEKKESRTGKCVVVQFVKWGECGEALRALRSHGEYWMKTTKKAHLAPPNTRFLPRVHPTMLPQLATTIAPYMYYDPMFTSMMPRFMEHTPSPSPSSSPERPGPKKRRRKGPYRMDALPPPQFNPPW